MDGLLDTIASELAARGVEVIRGPANTPGVVVPLPPETVQNDLRRADVAMFSSRWRCDRQTLSALPRLKGIVNATIGLETVDLEAADEMGIIVGHGGAPEHVLSMAEAAIMLMMNLMYGLRQSERLMSTWRPADPEEGPHANMLFGATIGIVGLGRIGRAVVDRLLPFGVKLLAYSPRAERSQIPDAVTLVDLATLMRESDLVGVFIAVRPDNKRLINADAIALMKRSAYLVNVARGDAIDEPALIAALRDRRIAGAALDTFATEPLPQDSELRSLPNVILTPHIVGHTRQSIDAVIRVAVENILNVLEGRLPSICKNPHVEPVWRRRSEAAL